MSKATDVIKRQIEQTVFAREKTALLHQVLTELLADVEASENQPKAKRLATKARKPRQRKALGNGLTATETEPVTDGFGN